jgi:hypothetical protein
MTTLVKCTHCNAWRIILCVIVRSHQVKARSFVTNQVMRNDPRVVRTQRIGSLGITFADLNLAKKMTKLSRN